MVFAWFGGFVCCCAVFAMLSRVKGLLTPAPLFTVAMFIFSGVGATLYSVHWI